MCTHIYMLMADPEIQAQAKHIFLRALGWMTW